MIEEIKALFTDTEVVVRPGEIDVYVAGEYVTTLKEEDE